MVLSFLGGIGITYGMAFDLIAPNKAIFSDPLLANRNPLVLCLPYMLAGFLIARVSVADRLRAGWLLIAAGLGVALVLAELLLLARYAIKGVAHDNMIALGPCSACADAAGAEIARHAWQAVCSATTPRGFTSSMSPFCALLFRFTDFGRPTIYALCGCGFDPADMGQFSA